LVVKEGYTCCINNGGEMRKIERRPRGLVLALVVLSAIAYAALAGSGAAAPQAPPVNTQEPSISGTARVGEVLQGDRGDWQNAQSFSLRWMRCDQSGGASDASDCAPIAQATGNTYRVRQADSGLRLRFRVIASNPDGSTTAASNPTARVQPASGAAAPSNTARPTITGDPQVGESLTASDGTWTGNPTSFAYQWQRCDLDAIVCGNVPGATGKSYGARAADVGFRVRVQVTARNASGAGTAFSTPSGIVVPRTPITNARPTISIISIRFTGARVYARVRICDDQPRNLAILVTETKRRVRASNRRFATRAAPRPCGAYTRSWIKPSRFINAPGRYKITLRTRDSGGNTSRPVSRTFRR
jgi:hypothetical protein